MKELINLAMGKLWPFLLSAVSKDERRPGMQVLHVVEEGQVLVTTDGRRIHIVRGGGKLPLMENGEYRLKKLGKAFFVEEEEEALAFPDWEKIVKSCEEHKPGRFVKYDYSGKGRLWSTLIIEGSRLCKGGLDADFIKPLTALEEGFTIRGKKEKPAVFRARVSGYDFEAYIQPFILEETEEKVDEGQEGKVV